MADIVSVYLELLAFFIRRFEADFIQHPLHDGMQAPRADILRAFIHAEGEAGHFFQRFGGEFQLHALGFEQRRVLLHQRRLRFGENADEIIHGERLQLHADRETSLQFGNQVAWFGNMECSRCDKQNVIGSHHSIAAINGSSFHNRQNVTLHALAGNVRSMAAFAARNFVDFVQEYDSRVFHAIDGHARNLVHIN